MFQVVLLASWPVTGHRKESDSILFAPFFQVVIHVDKSLPEPSLFQAGQFHLPQSVLMWEVLQCLNHLCGLSLEFPCYVHVSLVMRSPELDNSTPGVASPMLSRGEGSPPSASWLYMLIQPKIPLTFFLTRTHCWLRYSMVSTRTSRSSPVKLLSSWAAPSTYLDAHFPDAGFNTSSYWTSWDSCQPSLSRSLTVAAQLSGISATISSILSSANLLRVHSAPSSKWLMKMVNRTRRNIGPWGTPLTSN